MFKNYKLQNCFQLVKVDRTKITGLNFFSPTIRLTGLYYAEGLKNFPRDTKAKMQEMEQVGPGGPDRNKMMSLHPGVNNNQQVANRGAPFNGSALALTNYQNMLMRQNSINSSHSQQDPSSPFTTTSNHTPPGPSFSRPPSPIQQNQSLQQQMIQQLLQDMTNKNNGNAQNQARGDGFGFRASPAPNRSNSFNNNASNAEPPPVSSGNFSEKAAASDLGQNNLHMSDDLVPDVAHDFSENSFFNNDLDDGMTFDWKA